MSKVLSNHEKKEVNCVMNTAFVQDPMNRPDFSSSFLSFIVASTSG